MRVVSRSSSGLKDEWGQKVYSMYRKAFTSRFTQKKNKWSTGNLRGFLLLLFVWKIGESFYVNSLEWSGKKQEIIKQERKDLLE